VPAVEPKPALVASSDGAALDDEAPSWPVRCLCAVGGGDARYVECCMTHMAAADFCSDLVGDGLYCDLFDRAERARWKMSDIAWHQIRKQEVSAGLIELVRQAAFAELTTWSATRRFLQEFADDVDFTQWISVWFYEESTHPQVLMRWLHEFGQTCDSQFVRRGRRAAPFMKSRIGMLVTNVISELVASRSYLNLARNCPEPVLSTIAKNLASDEARHASSFYAYARRTLERVPDSDRQRLAALKVLYAWFQQNDRVLHPVNEFRGRAERSEEMASAMADMQLGVVSLEERIFRTIGQLIDVPLTSADDVRAAYTTLRGNVAPGEGEAT
jgi:rubrerythrin